MEKLKNNTGVTLVEILLGIIISTVMMGAMYTSYNAVSGSYSQVSDRAKISNQGRDLVGMIVRDIRNAGFRYFGDNIPVTSAHSPILITKAKNFNSECDTLVVVYGGGKYVSGKYQYAKYRVKYHCEPSKIRDKNSPKLPSGQYPLLKGFGVYKTKEIWDKNANKWNTNADTDAYDETFKKQLVADYIEDMVFIQVDENGFALDPPPSPTFQKEKLYKIKTVDVAITVRSTKPFYQRAAERYKQAISNNQRTSKYKGNPDRFFRDLITVTAHARNLGLQ